VITFTQQFDSNGKQLEQPQQVSLDPVEILEVSTRMNAQTQEYTETIELISGKIITLIGLDGQAFFKEYSKFMNEKRG